MTTHDIAFDYEDHDYIARCEAVPAEGGLVSPYVAAHLEVSLDTLRGFRADVWTRKTPRSAMWPGTSFVVLHTRWHPDDLIGTLAAPNQAAPWRQSCCRSLIK